MTKDEGPGNVPAGEGLSVESILDSLDEPVTVIDPDYHVRYINRAARQLFDMKGRAAGDVHCYEVSHRRSSPCTGRDHPCPMEKARRGERSARVLHEHFAGGGERRIVEIIASPLQDAEGAFAGIVESQRDVTEREETEKLLRNYANELSESNKLKDLFIDIMRHDLLGPAGLIRNAAALAMRHDSPTLDGEEIEIIHRSSRKMIDLIHNASVLAKLQEMNRLSFEPAEVKHLLAGAVDEVKGWAAERNVTFRIECDRPCGVRANPLLGTVFTNLLSNAVKYGPGDAEVVISVVRQDNRCLVSVADRGEGIPDDAKEEVFTRFSRLDKGAVKGSGLGLAIVKQVVDLHGGRCWVEDNPGGGSVFRVELEAL